MKVPQFLSIGQVCNELELVAVNPLRFSADEACLVRRGPCSGKNITELAQRLLPIIQSFGAPSADELRRLQRCIALLNRTDKAGQVAKVFSDVIQACQLKLPEFKIPEPSKAVSELSAAVCQKILSGYSIERAYLTMLVRSVTDQIRVNTFQTHLEALGDVRISNAADVCTVYSDLDFYELAQDPQLFALLLKHPQRMEEGRIHLAHITPELSEAVSEVLRDGLLSDSGRRVAELIVRWRERVRVVTRGNHSAKETMASMAAFHAFKSRFSPQTVEKLAPYGLRAMQLQLGISEHLTNTGSVLYPDSYLEATMAVWDSYLDALPGIERLYRAVQERLVACKPPNSAHRTVRQAYYDCLKPLAGTANSFPESDVFSALWDCTPPKPSKVDKKKEPSSKPKTKKATSKKSSTKAADVPAPVLQALQPVKPAAVRISYAGRVLDFLRLTTPAADRSVNEIEHGFALAVDEHITALGIRTIWHNPNTQNKDILYSIPGEIEYPVRGLGTKRGLFTYCFEEARPSHCYHRCFMKKPADEMVEEYARQRFWEIDFPALGEQQEDGETEQDDRALAPDQSRVVKDIGYVIEIEDPKNGAILRLFKLNVQ